MSLVRYRTNDYSVPTAHAYQDVLIKGYVDRVEIICGGARVAVHARSYEREDFIADPLHYLALIERKPRALDQAAPLDKWLLSEDVHRMRRLMDGTAAHDPGDHVTGDAASQGRAARVHPGAAAVRAF
jgi:hypothetical protein